MTHKSVKTILGDLYPAVLETSKMEKYAGTYIESLFEQTFTQHSDTFVTVDESRDGYFLEISGPAIIISQAMYESDMFDVFESVGNGVDFDVKKYYSPEILSSFVYKLIESRFILNIKEDVDEPIHIKFTGECEEFSLSALVVNVVNGSKATIIEELNSYASIHACIDYSLSKESELNLITMHYNAVSTSNTFYRYLYVGENAKLNHKIVGNGSWSNIDETRLFPNRGSEIDVIGAIATVGNSYTHIVTVHSAYQDFKLNSMILSLRSGDATNFNHRTYTIGKVPEDCELHCSEYDVDIHSDEELITRDVVKFLKFVEKNITLPDDMESGYFSSLRTRIIKGI